MSAAPQLIAALEPLPAAFSASIYLAGAGAWHEEALRLYSTPGLEQNLDFERRHKVIIDRFGRYPHRNAILGRASTPEELEFLAQPGSSF